MPFFRSQKVKSDFPEKLVEYFPGSIVNFDLNDCDNVLRVEGNSICPVKIIGLVTADGYECEALI
jgi:hypothetical protein